MKQDEILLFTLKINREINDTTPVNSIIIKIETKTSLLFSFQFQEKSRGLKPSLTPWVEHLVKIEMDC